MNKKITENGLLNQQIMGDHMFTNIESIR
jgi:hypothetical protein